MKRLVRHPEHGLIFINATKAKQLLGADIVGLPTWEDTSNFIEQAIQQATKKAQEEAEFVNCNECSSTIPLSMAHVLCDVCLNSYIDN